MAVYVIAATPTGPCKIGVAANPMKRLRALQTGSPARLELFHVEPVQNSRAVERAILNALAHRQDEGGKEWFKIDPVEARMQVRIAAASAGVFFDENSTLYEIQDSSLKCWFAELRKLEDQWDEEKNGQYEEPTDGGLLDPLDMFAESVFAPPTKKFDFNDYLLSWDEGIRFRWAFEQLGRRMPAGKALGAYRAADKYLEGEEFISGRELSKRWIEWSLGRELLGDEAYFLARIWNQFSEAFNLVERSRYRSMRGDDYVDNVHVHALSGDRERGDRDRVVFRHGDFRAVLAPNKKAPLFEVSDSLRIRLNQIDATTIRGFVAPVLTSDVWSIPFRPWVSSSAQRRDNALGEFLAKPDKKYPSPRPLDSAPPGTLVHIQLPVAGPQERF